MIKKSIIAISVLVFTIVAYQASSSSSENSSLKSEIRELRADLAELRVRVTKLESQLNNNTTIHKKSIGGQVISK